MPIVKLERIKTDEQMEFIFKDISRHGSENFVPGFGGEATNLSMGSSHDRILANIPESELPAVIVLRGWDYLATLDDGRFAVVGWEAESSLRNNVFNFDVHRALGGFSADAAARYIVNGELVVDEVDA
jgi:hypothetical protein